MNKHNILGSVLLGCMMAFIVVMPAFASEGESSARATIKTCVKAVEVNRKADKQSARTAFKASEQAAITAWKAAVAEAKQP